MKPNPILSNGISVAADYLGKGAFAYGGDQDCLSNFWCGGLPNGKTKNIYEDNAGM